MHENRVYSCERLLSDPPAMPKLATAASTGFGPRLAALRKELADIRERASAMRAQWEGEKKIIHDVQGLKAKIDEARLAETLAVMGSLEALAGELACRHASDAQLNEIRALHFEMLACHARGDLAGYFKFNQAIHLRIVKYSGNAVLYNIYRQMNGNLRRARYMANLSKERWDAAVREHDEILAALGARDVKRIKALLSDHLAHKLASVLAALPAQHGKAA